ncbi:MAG: outer membrane lipoprotein-sorting protein [Myxococcales bacterium]|nr:outer membrane lipoprotein-sorting protein [Myxococcales bacterium]
MWDDPRGVNVNKAKRTSVSVALLIAAAAFAPPAHALSGKEVLSLLKLIDQRQRNSGDWKARFFLEQKQKDKDDIVYDGIYFRRDENDRLMILFLKPKAERGKGYLRINKNLWFYDARVGKWERRTERERIGGTNSNRQDFDESRLAEEYIGRYLGDGKLGRYKTWRLELKAKKGVDVAYPKVRLWIDQASKNILKRQDFAASGKLLRTSYYPRWYKVHSPSKKADVWYPKEIRIFDEVEKANRTTFLIRKVDLRSLPANIFTKAWLESKSR